MDGDGGYEQMEPTNGRFALLYDRMNKAVDDITALGCKFIDINAGTVAGIIILSDIGFDNDIGIDVVRD